MKIFDPRGLSALAPGLYTRKYIWPPFSKIFLFSMLNTFKIFYRTNSPMIMKHGMEQFVLKLNKVYINDDPELTLTYFITCQIWRNFFCTHSKPIYQLSVYRTIGPLVI